MVQQVADVGTDSEVIDLPRVDADFQELVSRSGAFLCRRSKHDTFTTVLDQSASLVPSTDGFPVLARLQKLVHRSTATGRWLRSTVAGY